MSFETVILGAGHGGIISGAYQTPGKRSPVWSGGAQLFEGEFNRAVKARIKEKLFFDGIKYVDINPEEIDISLNERVKRANKIKDSFFVSIHANAGGGTGSEIFISENASFKSQKIAFAAEDEYKNIFNGLKWRGIKRANFTVIKKTIMPAVLFECFFMDNKKECKEILLTEGGRDLCAEWIYKTILKAFHI